MFRITNSTIFSRKNCTHCTIKIAKERIFILSSKQKKVCNKCCIPIISYRILRKKSGVNRKKGTVNTLVGRRNGNNVGNFKLFNYNGRSLVNHHNRAKLLQNFGERIIRPEIRYTLMLAHAAEFVKNFLKIKNLFTVYSHILYFSQLI